MEQEHPLSKFQKIPLSEMLPTASVFSASNIRPTNSYNLINKTSDISRKILSKGYRQLDSLAGLQSYFLLDFPNNFAAQPIYEIFELLKNNNLINYNLADFRYNDAPFFYRVDIMPNYEKNSTDGEIIKSSTGHGFGKDADEVFSKAIGEFLERYFLTLYHKKNFIRGSVNDLKKLGIPLLNLKFLPTFSKEQRSRYPRRIFNDDSVFYWEKIRSLSTNKSLYAPAQIVYWNYKLNETEPRLGESNTNGAGGFFTREGAILAGLYEVVQRDSFLIYWLNGIAPKRIDPKTIPDDNFQKLLQESERYGFNIYCLNITTDTGLPVFAVIVSDPSRCGPRFCLGCGCQADPAKALYRALEEAWSVYFWMRPRPVFPALDKNYRPFYEKISQDERLRLWANPEMEEYLNFFISGKTEQFSDVNFDFPNNFSSQAEELDFLVKRIESLGPGYEVFCFEAQHHVLSSLGYHSARAIVPQFIPLYLTEYNAPLGSSRIKEVPRKLGFSSAIELNPLPHPFP